MNSHDSYSPGAAAGAQIEKDGERWTLVVTRELRHAAAKVWEAITQPEHLREWAPFDADRSMGTTGTVTLTTVGAPSPHVTETTIRRADPPRTLEYNWGGQELRWQLEPNGAGTRLTLWHNIDRRYIAMGAAGWQICLDVMERALAGQPIGRLVGPEAMKIEGFPRLHAEYAKQFGVELPSWGAPKA